MAMATLSKVVGYGMKNAPRHLVLCPNKDKGCEWRGNDITGHLKSNDGCEFEEVKCSNDCGLMLQRRNLLDHVDYECPLRKICCQYCSTVGPYYFIMCQHVDQCHAKVPLPSPNKCGVDSILRKTTCTSVEELIKCPNDCGETLKRQFMSIHVETECLCREIECQYCELPGEYHFIEGRHKEECPKLFMGEYEIGTTPHEDVTENQPKYPLEVTECDSNNSMEYMDTIGCEDKSEHEEKTEDLNFISHKLIECQAKIDELEFEKTTLLKLLCGDWAMQLNVREVQSSLDDQELPVIMRMPDYSSSKTWYSHPFYTQEKGYKVQLKVSNCSCYGYLSVSLCVVKGLYDDKLSWPMKGKFQVRLLNQIVDSGHHSRTGYVYKSDQPTSNVDTEDIWSEPFFIRIASELLSQYLENDSLIFEVLKVEDRSEC